MMLPNREDQVLLAISGGDLDLFKRETRKFLQVATGSSDSGESKQEASQQPPAPESSQVTGSD